MRGRGCDMSQTPASYREVLPPTPHRSDLQKHKLLLASFSNYPLLVVAVAFLERSPHKVDENQPMMHPIFLLLGLLSTLLFSIKASPLPSSQKTLFVAQLSTENESPFSYGVISSPS
jgi:hypothetical protein